MAGVNSTLSQEETQALLTIECLQDYPQWVCASQPGIKLSNGKIAEEKAPINPRTGNLAMPNIPDTWGSHSLSLERWQREPERLMGIGYMLVKEQGITCTDLDNCIDEQGHLKPWARKIVDILNSYTEYSPSGRGLHIWTRGEIPKLIGPDPTGAVKVEMYDRGHYMTITGQHLEGTPTTIEDRQGEILILHMQVIKDRERVATAARAAKRQEQATPTQEPLKSTAGDTRYGLKVLRDECQLLASTAEGGRNHQLNKAAFAIGRVIAGGELTQETAERELINAARSIGLGDFEIQKSMASGIKKGKKAPRSAPPLSQQSPAPDPAQQQTGSFFCTDLGNAERFAAKYQDKVRWCEVWNTWLVFNGKCWEPDRSGRVDQLAKATVRAIYQEAADEPDDASRKQLAKHATRSESNRAVRAMLDRAKSELAAAPEDFNKHLYLFNCENGTLDLRTGELRPHDHNDMLTRCIKVKYNPLARSARWDSFMKKFLDGNIDLIKFMQQALGMSLCGDTSEQCLFICHGMGSNGKTTMLEVVRMIMGAYACAANIETFQVQKNDTIRNDIAELYGARLVTAEETKLGGRLNEALVKKATGKQPLRARRLHENEFEFMPEFTLWLAVNHKPVVLDTSKGMWRRVHFIPFNVTIDDDQADKHFGDKLLEEAEGILTWLVQGCRQWIDQGRLIAPKAVQEATASYRAEMDIVANFLNDECILGPGKKATTKQLLARFEAWCGQNSEHFDAKILKNSLKERGYYSQRGHGGNYYWHGLELKPDATHSLLSLSEEEVDSKTGERGERGEGKNRVNQELKNPPDATSNSRSPRSPRSPSELKNEGNGEGTFTQIEEKAEKAGQFSAEIEEKTEKTQQLLAEIQEIFKKRADIPQFWRDDVSAARKIPQDDYIRRVRDAIASANPEQLQRAITAMMWTTERLKPGRGSDE